MSLPEFGPDRSGASERHCGRTVNDVLGPGQVLCAKAASHHVITEEETLGGRVESSWACRVHVGEWAKWKPMGLHPVGSDCGMPGSQWYPDADECRCDGLVVAEPLRVVAVA